MFFIYIMRVFIMDFASKIRGSRAVLGWTREELGRRAGLSVPGITGIEQGGSPNARSRKKIIRAFENAGLVFTRTGIEQDDSPVVLLTHENPEQCYLLLLDDVARVLGQAHDPELLISYADDRVSSNAVNDRYRALRGAGVAMRQLVEDSNTYLLGPLEEYRAIPADHFVNRVTLIYGDNIAIVTAGENTITIIRDSLNAARERSTFNLLWSVLPQPAESTADERF